MNKTHEFLANLVAEGFLKKGFLVEKELPLLNGKGAVDVFAKKDKLNIYFEIKSNPTSVYSKKVRNQLRKYINHFGKENLYYLASPDAQGNLKVSSLEGLNFSLCEIIKSLH